jgi:hypothetical protein
MLNTTGDFSSEGARAAADIQYPSTRAWQLPQ